MYEAFDRFLAMDTWHTRHPADVRRFFQALDNVVRDPNFTADRFREYLLTKLSPAQRADSYWMSVVEDYHDKADAVRDYLDAIS